MNLRHESPGWSSETYLRAAHSVSDKSLAELEKLHAVIGSGQRLHQRLRRRYDNTEKSLRAGTVKYDCWRLVSERACDCNFTSGGCFTFHKNPGGCKYCPREKSMHRSNRFGSYKYVSPHWIILPPATEYTQLKWKALKSWHYNCFSTWFEVSGGREGVKPQTDTCYISH